MYNFQFYNPTRIIFGKNQEKQLGFQVKKYGSNVLLIFGEGSIKKNGIYEKVVSALKEQEIRFIELEGIVPNPHLSKVREGIEIGKKEKIDFILAVGGGSVIDSAKAIASGIKNDLDIWKYFTHKENKINQSLPIGTVLTIPASGSESSPTSVITDSENKLKKSISSEAIIPKFAILNPEFTYSLPGYQTACGASDILAHLLERYFTQAKYIDLSDRLIEGAICNILAYGPLAYQEPNNYAARAETMWCGTIANNNLLCRGRLADWASHAIAYQLSAMYNLAHGAAMAIIFPAWMQYVYQENIDKFIQFASRVFNLKNNEREKEKTIKEVIIQIKKWYKSMNLPTTLEEVGIDMIHFGTMANNALCEKNPLGRFKELNQNDIVNIYQIALSDKKK